MFHSGPIRPGTRGGQGDFSWVEVSADKDRENYLGHSINAPTGRWQKNKDVHWYNRDDQGSEQDKLDEIRMIKQAEEDAMAAALGFKPNTRDAGEGSSAGNPNAIPVKSKEEDAAKKNAAKEEKRRLKEERRATKERRRALKVKERADHRYRHQDERLDRYDRAPERPRYSRSPEPARVRPRNSRSPSLTRRDYHFLRRSRSPRRSPSPRQGRERYSPRRAHNDERTPPRRR